MLYFFFVNCDHWMQFDWMHPFFNLKEKSSDKEPNPGPQTKRGRYESSYPQKRKVGENVEALWEEDGTLLFFVLIFLFLIQ